MYNNTSFLRMHPAFRLGLSSWVGSTHSTHSAAVATLLLVQHVLHPGKHATRQ